MLTDYKEVSKLDYKAINTVFTHYKHKSGLEIIHAKNDDKDKVFSVGFFTPPKSTGVTHILEHYVLEAGTKKYPGAETFRKLDEQVMTTFLNAFTYPHTTIYLGSSGNTEEYKKLADVLLSCVFEANKNEMAFMIEGWRVEVEDNLPKYCGVVYNEMHASLSTPGRIADMNVTKSLFPNAMYSEVSGGDPQKIPLLSFEELWKYYKTYYSIQNARVFVWGDISIEEIDLIIKPYLNKKIEISKKSSPKLIQDEKLLLKETIKKYPADKGSKLCFVYTGFILTEAKSVKEEIIRSISSGVLFSKDTGIVSTAYAKKAIGTSFNDDGYNSYTKQPHVLFGANYVAPEKINIAKTLWRTIIERLKNDVRFRKNVVMTKNRILYWAKQISEQSPRGMEYVDTIYMRWVYGEEPLSRIDVISELESLTNEKLAEIVFDNIKKEYLNAKAIICISEPDANYKQKIEKRIQSTEKQINVSKEIVDNDIKVKTHQKTVQLLPLPINSIKPSEITKEFALPDYELFENEMKIYANTNGIIYRTLSFDFSDIPEEDLWLMNIFSSMINRSGLKNLPHEERIREIRTYTGSFASAITVLITKEKRTKLLLKISSSHLTENDDKVIDIIKRTVEELSFDQTRLESIYKEALNNEKNAVKAMHAVRYAKKYADSKLTEYGSISEKMSGLSYREQLIKNEGNYSNILAKLIQFKEKIPNSCTYALIGGDKNIAKMNTLFQVWKGSNKQYLNVSINRSKDFLFDANSQVNSVALCGKVQPVAEGISEICTEYINAEFMAGAIRKEIGAYGGNCIYSGDRLSIISLISWANPKPKETIKLFKSLGDTAIKKLSKLNKNELDKYIIKAVTDLEAPKTPGEMIYSTFGLVQAERPMDYYSTLKKTILEADKHQVINSLKTLFNTDRYEPTVIGNGEQLKNEFKGEDVVNLF